MINSSCRRRELAVYYIFKVIGACQSGEFVQFFFNEMFSKAMQKMGGKREHACHLKRAKPRGLSPKMRINVTVRYVRIPFSPFYAFTVCLTLPCSDSCMNVIFVFESPQKISQRCARRALQLQQKYFSQRSNLVVTEFLRQIRVPAIKYKFNRANVSP